MLDGFERRRSAGHLIRVFELAAAAGALTDPDLAVSRMSRVPQGAARDRARPALAQPGDGQQARACPRRSTCASGTTFAAIGLWREHVARTGLAAAAAHVKAAGLSVSSLCRGGFFTHADPVARAAAIADNKAAIAEAAALGTDTLVLVSGGLVPGSRDIGLARRMIADAIAELVPVAQDNGVRLGIEALHPVFAADRCVITRLGEALDLALAVPGRRRGRRRRHLPRLVGRVAADRHRAGGGADRQLPGLRLDPAAARPTPSSAAATSATATSTSRPSPPPSRRRATPGPSRWRSSTRPSGTPPPTKPPPRSPTASR